MDAALDSERMVDLAGRWLRARRSAALKVTGETSDALDELALVARAMALDEAQALRNAFSHSHALGQSYRRFFKDVPSLRELPAFLGALGSPCLLGLWEAEPLDDGARRLTRGGCAWGVDARLCDWWRECADGLVLGLTGGVRHARHQSRGHGNAQCLDVLFEGDDNPLRFGPIPPEMTGELRAISSMVRLCDSTARLDWLGLSEGVLLYRLTQPQQDSGLSLRGMVEQQLGRRLPDVKPQELAPLPVLGAGGE